MTSLRSNSALLSLALTLLLPRGAVAGETTSHYRAWFDTDILSIHVPRAEAGEGLVRTGHDTSEKAELCTPTSGYFCLFSRSYGFAVPRDGAGKRKEWTVRGVRFEVIRTGLTVSIFGVEIPDLVLIRAPAEASLTSRELGKPTLFLYSNARGIVGFAREPGPDNITALYWLVDDRGFGATR